MAKHAWLMIPVLTAGLGMATPSVAQESDVIERLESMQSEIDGLRSDKAAMRDEIDELRASADETWLTEQRADEVRQLVYDTLADADTRSSLMNDGLVAGWSEHFFLASPDGRFKLQLAGQIQTRFVLAARENEADRFRSGFENTRTKLEASGHVFNPDTTYFLRTDATRDETGLVTGLFFVQDAWIRFQMNDHWSFRVGQYKVPFNREELVSSAYQLGVERSLINETFSVGRTQGIELTFAGRKGRWSISFHDGANDKLAPAINLQGGAGLASLRRVVAYQNALIEENEWAFASRYEHLFAGQWDQFRDLTSTREDDFGMLVGVAANAQATEAGSSTDQIQWFAITADVSLEFGGANFFASGTYHYIDSIFGAVGQIHAWGFMAQGGMFISPKLELYTRFEYALWDWELQPLSDLTVATVGFNYYIDGHDLKWSTDVGLGISQIEGFFAGNPEQTLTGFQAEPNGERNQLVFRTQLQLLF